MRFPPAIRPAFLLAALLLAALLLSPATAAAQPATDLSADDLERVIRRTIDGEAFRGATWGIHVADLRTGAVLFSEQADRNLIPASNVKLSTSAAALDRLGPGYRYRTHLYADGPVRDGVLKGNLIVRGTGDPTIGGEEQQDDVTRLFRAWADSLRSRGVRRIEGHVVGDDDFFSDVPYGTGWSWDDTAYAYSAEVSALSFNLNKINLRVRGGSAVDAPGRIRWAPLNTSYVSVVNRSRTVASTASVEEDYSRRRGQNTIVVGTRVPVGATETEELAVANPTRYFVHVLREVLLREGIAVDGAALDADAAPIKPSYESSDLRSVASVRSAPLAQIVTTLNRESVNLYAEMLLRTLAVVDAPPASADLGTPARGAAAVRATLGAAGVDTSRVEIADGSGLSRQNLMTARGTVQLLQYMWTHEDPDVRTAFYESLPVGGRNGTLQYRFGDGEPAAGNVRAKTGTLSGVSALSGYVSTGRGSPVGFSIICNNYAVEGRVVRRAQDAIVNALARLGER